ncbi:hypothetical protein A8F94_05495 [Bacillus sp. FJAT-27225]|uniref:acyl-CoA thioesterase n=1 Tax=Bacillus sp. FJAT-27225 TaxID=1743144 RepID=UPI00080C34F6|nr:thioesterase family protein [Bacillus sp. FJAT-27225]OCA91314.1 hypothetical protein A8F94_05495 [Bacillus sp. FJAT-27225]
MSRIGYIEDIEEWKNGFHFSYPVKVRFSETDMFGHLNNTVPFTYFELARIEFFKNIGFMQDWVRPGNETIPVVADLQCDFLKQVYFDEPIDIFVKANKIGTSSVDIHYMGKTGKGDICFTGRGTMVQISKKTGKGVPWTDEMKKLLANPENPAIIK